MNAGVVDDDLDRARRPAAARRPRCAAARSVTSKAIASALPPAATIASAIASAASSRVLAWTMTWAPSRASRSAIAWPMPPLAPVTRARRPRVGLARSLMAAAMRDAGVEHDGEAPGGDLAARVLDAKGVEEPSGIARLALGDDAQRVALGGGQVVEPPGAEPDLARARQEARRRASRPRPAPAGRRAGPRLRRVLDRRAGHQAAAAAQRMGRVAVAGGDAFDPARRPRPPCDRAGTSCRGAAPAPRCRRGRAWPGSGRSLRGGPRVATRSTFANGVPSVIGRLRHLRSRGRRAARSIPRPAGRSAAAPVQPRSRNDQAVDPLAGREAAPRGGIADAQQQRPPVAERGAHARQHLVLLARARRSAARRG